MAMFIMKWRWSKNLSQIFLNNLSKTGSTHTMLCSGIRIQGGAIIASLVAGAHLWIRISLEEHDWQRRFFCVIATSPSCQSPEIPFSSQWCLVINTTVLRLGSYEECTISQATEETQLKLAGQHAHGSYPPGRSTPRPPQAAAAPGIPTHDRHIPWHISFNRSKWASLLLAPLF